ncbi:helix-turn-helix domain-containing protein [Planctomycetes bacterium K23_9]|uniref:Helix-turn-helix domain protein n=1 Tax=Stieleria marina TaxID=1930275 RepID=A0A517NYJ2_9BACT|nr:Helix-turn-helix domain protein [Planctomycetes bacterium K23_9]
MSAQQPHFSPKQVAKSLEVSESSIKRWCDQGVIPTVKTSGGHRRISLEGLHDFLQASGREFAHPEELGGAVLPQRRRTRIPGKRHPTQAAFREALADSDEMKCEQLVRQWLADGWSRSETANDLITDALRGIGEAWNCHEIDVYRERVACGICMRLIHKLRTELPPVEHDAPLAIGGTLTGDAYEVPTALVDLMLHELGWRSLNLGTNLPVESYLQAASDHRPTLVWLSISTIDDQSQFIANEIRLSNSLDDEVSLIVGGRALCDQIRPQLSYTAHCDSLSHLAQLATMIKNRFGLES